MRLKIVTGGNDGVACSQHVKVYDVDTGEIIPGIYKAEWSCEVGHIAKVTLWMNAVDIDAEGVYDVTALGDAVVGREYVLDKGDGYVWSEATTDST